MDAQVDAQVRGAVVYARTSKEYKNVERVSIAQQVEDGQKLAEREKWRVVGVYIDEDRSSQLPPRQLAKEGQKKFREGLTNMLAVIESGQAQIIITRKSNRLSRVYEMSRDLYRWLDDRKIIPAFTHEMPRNTKDAAGRLSFNMLSLIAEYELDNTKETTKAGKDYAKRHGLKMGPVWTFGYGDGPTKGTVVVDPEAAAIVREVFDRYLSGETVMDITRWLNDTHRTRCRPKLRNQDAAWHPVSIRRMLCNRRYVGLNEDGTTSQLYQPILSPEIFWKAQEMLGARSAIRVARKAHDRPLRGLLICGHCNRTMQAIGMAKGTEAKLYACGRTDITHPRPFVMRESRWIEFLRIFFVRDLAPNIDSKESALLKAQLAGFDANLTELAAMVGKELTPKAYAAATKELEARREKAYAQLSNLPPKQADYDPNDWHGLGNHEKRELLRAFIDRIVVYQDYCEVFGAESPGVPFRFPAMKEPQHGLRAATCLCPSGFSRANADEILVDIDHRLCGLAGKPEPATWADEYVMAQWGDWLSERFYPATEFEARLVSRRARKRHGLEGGRNYPGQKKSVSTVG